jgi:hypothetical protein
MATLLKVLNNLADIKSAGVLHLASELRVPGYPGDLARLRARTFFERDFSSGEEAR